MFLNSPNSQFFDLFDPVDPVDPFLIYLKFKITSTKMGIFAKMKPSLVCTITMTLLASLPWAAYGRGSPWLVRFAVSIIKIEDDEVII